MDIMLSTMLNSVVCLMNNHSENVFMYSGILMYALVRACVSECVKRGLFLMTLVG